MVLHFTETLRDTNSWYQLGTQYVGPDTKYTHNLPYYVRPVLPFPVSSRSVRLVRSHMDPSLRPYHTGVPPAVFVFPWIEPGHCKNMPCFHDAMGPY